MISIVCELGHAWPYLEISVCILYVVGVVIAASCILVGKRLTKIEDGPPEHLVEKFSEGWSGCFLWIVNQ